ncbi:MAG: tyrosine-type recombinase/integrase [Acidimicrobiales bacterium]
MAGSIRPVPGASNGWELRVYIGRSSKGRVRHRSKRFYGSRRAAEKELARLVTEHEQAPAPVPEAPAQWGSTTTVNDAIEGWKANGWNDLSPKTVQDYEWVWRLHIADSIGKKRIATLSTFEVESFYRQLKDNGVGKHTVRLVKVVVSRACRLASKWSVGTLPNPAAEAELPRWKGAARPKPRAPTREEAGRMLVHAERQDIRLAVFLRLVAATGARRGEVCGVRWSDLDWENSVVRIDENVVAAAGGARTKEPKTLQSVRTAHLDADTVKAMRELYKAQVRLARVAEVPLGSEAFVFSFDAGGATPPHPDTITKHFAAVRKQANVPDDVQPIHGWRHFQATELDGVISERQKQHRLGWSTTHPAMSRHYTDAVDEEDRRAATHIQTVLRAAQDAAGSPGSGSPPARKRSTARREK